MAIPREYVGDIYIYIYSFIRVRCKNKNKLLNINNSYQSVPVTGKTAVTMKISLFLVKQNVGYVHDSEGNSHRDDVALCLIHVQCKMLIAVMMIYLFMIIPLGQI